MLGQGSQKSRFDGINILDLTAKKTLFELALDPQDLIGVAGAKMIADLKDRAFDADYTHMYYRDPVRPGIIWFAVLGSSDELPTRGRLDRCRKAAEKAFPGLIETLESYSEKEKIMSEVPTLKTGIELTGLELTTALEYIVFLFPDMVRAWAALLFSYAEILKLSEAAERVREECISACPQAQIVVHFLSEQKIEI